MTRDEFQTFNRGALVVMSTLCDSLNTFDNIEKLKASIRGLRLELAEICEKNEDIIEAMKRYETCPSVLNGKLKHSSTTKQIYISEDTEND